MPKVKSTIEAPPKQEPLLVHNGLSEKQVKNSMRIACQVWADILQHILGMNGHEVKWGITSPERLMALAIEFPNTEANRSAYARFVKAFIDAKTNVPAIIQEQERIFAFKDFSDMPQFIVDFFNSNKLIDFRKIKHTAQKTDPEKFLKDNFLMLRQDFYWSKQECFLDIQRKDSGIPKAFSKFVYSFSQLENAIIFDKSVASGNRNNFGPNIFVHH